MSSGPMTGRWVSVPVTTSPPSSQISWKEDLAFVEQVTCPDGEDGFTVVFTFAEGERTEVNVATFKTKFIKIGGPEWDTLTEDQQASIDYACGTGPYLLTELVNGTSVTLTRNENYYGTDPRPGFEGNKLPYIDTVKFIYIADSTNIVSQFTSGSLDWFGSRNNLINDSRPRSWPPAARILSRSTTWSAPRIPSRCDAIRLPLTTSASARPCNTQSTWIPSMRAITKTPPI